jgi:Cytochrome P460
MRSSIRTSYLAAIGTLLAGLAFAQSRPGGLSVARYDAQGRLEFPAGTDRWIGVGAGLGGNYADVPFDAANPGSIGVVQMEPTAYDYFLRNGRYADGTMFLLTFYATQKKPDPALQGFVQGDVMGREIHVLDKSRFPQEGSGFFVFSQGTAPAAPMPIGSVCVQCHSEHGAFDGTFVQFYPVLRGRLGSAPK